MSDIRIYVINFTVDHQTNLPALHQYFADSIDVLGYWNYIPLVYCVKTRLSATEMALKLAPFFASGFMVAEINPANMNGRLVPPAAWEWFYEPPAEKTAGLFGMAGLLGLPKS
jgi:hypothetical protein